MVEVFEAAAGRGPWRAYRRRNVEATGLQGAA